MGDVIFVVIIESGIVPFIIPFTIPFIILVFREILIST